MKGARLEIIGDTGPKRLVAVNPAEGDPFTIGRSHTNALPLGNAEISRHHAEIVRVEDRLILRDLGSRAGTFVNEDAIDEHTLSHGDAIRIGRRAELRFLIDEITVDTSDTSSAVGDLRQTATLLEGLRALGTAKVLDQVLAMVIDYAIVLSGAERGFIMLVNAAGVLEFKLGRGRAQTTLPDDQFQTSRKIPAQVFSTGEPQLVPDLHDELFAEDHAGTVQLGIRTVHCVPLRLVRYVEEASEAQEPRAIGVLYLDSREKGSLRSPAVQVGLETMAAEAAVAIENARLYRESQEHAWLEREMHTAHEFQQALLPAAPPTRDYFVAAAEMVPCLSIGGDFYDYLDLDNRFGFVLGDVAGKGAAAGLLGARVQEIFAHRAPGTEPAATVTAINTVMVLKGLDSRFVTLFYGILAPDGELTYCNAGHNPPLVIGAGGVRRLSTGGLIVGLFDDATYEQDVVQLRQGDTVVIYSDGVTEATNAEGSEFGETGIIECVQHAPRGLGPGELVQAVMTAVADFTVGAPQSDDITVLVIRYR